MQYFALEIMKVRHRKLGLFLFLFYTLGLPLLIALLARFGRTGPEGTYVDEVAMSFLSFSLIYLFLPLWVIVLTGTEFSSGHVHRVVFLTSRAHYVKSKMAFSILTATMFASTGIVTLGLSEIFSPYPFLEIPFVFYIKYFFQAFLTFLAFTLFLMSLLFFMRKIILTYVVYFAWQFLEIPIYLIGAKHGEKPVYLPLHLLNALFAHDGDVKLENYFMLFDQWKATYIGLAVMLVVCCAAAYRYFMRSSLFSLSD